MLSQPMIPIEEDMKYNTLHSNNHNSECVTMSQQFKQVKLYQNLLYQYF
jgi:hypothetical protein